jgi:hypothetical protein
MKTAKAKAMRKPHEHGINIDDRGRPRAGRLIFEDTHNPAQVPTYTPDQLCGLLRLGTSLEETQAGIQALLKPFYDAQTKLANERTPKATAR